MKVATQNLVGYTDDPLWGFCSVYKTVWDNGKVTWTVEGSERGQVALGDMVAFMNCPVSRDVPFCPALRRPEDADASPT